MKYLEFMFSGFWTFIGCTLILSGAGNLIMFIWNRFWRHFNIRKHGYPPIHCDADGDFKKEKKEKKEDE